MLLQTMPRDPGPSSHGSTPGVDAALFAVAAMWASTFSLFKIAWHDLDPVAFTGIRFAAMLVFSIGLLALSKNRIRARREDVPLLVASGLTGYFLYQMGFVLGLERTSALASAPRSVKKVSESPPAIKTFPSGSRVAV